MQDFWLQGWETIISSVLAFWAFVWWIVEKIKSEKLKTRLEIEKNKNILNDKKFRETYESFIWLMFDVLWKKKGINIEQWIMNFMRWAVLFAGPETIKTFGLYRKEAGKGGDVISYLEKLILAMRKDLWVSNDCLKEYDIIQVFVLWDASEEMKKWR